MKNAIERPILLLVFGEQLSVLDWFSSTKSLGLLVKDDGSVCLRETDNSHSSGARRHDHHEPKYPAPTQ